MSAVYMSVAHVEDMIKKDEPVQKYYDLQEELGRGRFAVVKKCVSKDSGEMFAAKIIKKSRHGGRSGREQLLLEIDILHQSDHPKLVRLYDVFETRTEMILILEYAPGGDLHRHCIEGDNVRTEKEICYLIRQITEAVRYLHSKNVVHLDLKPDNILLKRAGQLFPEIRLIDFGLSRRVDVAYTQCDIVGTPEYVAPEVLAFEPLELGSDMWSVGVVTYVLLSGISPFAGDDVMETYANIGMVEYDFDCEEFDEVSDEAIDFIEKLLLRKPKERMTAREAMEHAWLKQLEDGLSSADIVAALSAQSEGPPEDIDLSPLKVEDDVVSSASDEVSEVSEAFDDSTSDASECKSIEASESADAKSSDGLVETGKPSSVSSADLASAVDEKRSVSSEEEEAVPVMSKEPVGCEDSASSSRVAAWQARDCTGLKREDNKNDSESPSGVVPSAPRSHASVEDNSTNHKNKENKSVEHETGHDKSAEQTPADSEKQKCQDPKSDDVLSVRLCEENAEKKEIDKFDLKVANDSDTAKPCGLERRSEPVEVSLPSRGKTPDKLGSETSKVVRPPGKEMVPGGIASKMASKFSNYQDNFEKKSPNQKPPVSQVGNLKVNSLKIGEGKVLPSESPKVNAKDHSLVASPRMGSKFASSSGDPAKPGLTFGLNESGKPLFGNDAKDIKAPMSERSSFSKNSPNKSAGLDESSLEGTSKVLPTVSSKSTEPPSPKYFKEPDVTKATDLSNATTPKYPRSRSSDCEGSSAASNVSKASGFVSTALADNVKVSCSPEETRRSSRASESTDEGRKSASPKTNLKAVGRQNSSEGAGKGLSSPVVNGAVSRESDSKSSVTMKIGGPKFNIGPIVSMASQGKSEDISAPAPQGDRTPASPELGAGTPVKMKMSGGSLKLSLDVSKPKGEAPTSVEQKQIEAEKSESFDEQGLFGKKRASTMQEVGTWALDESGDKSKSATLRESRKASLVRREDTQRKTYRRLYVTKVRNSKASDVDMSCATETAEIKQRVENDVLKIDFVLKSTDLMLLPR